MPVAELRKNKTLKDFRKNPDKKASNKKKSYNNILSKKLKMLNLHQIEENPAMSLYIKAESKEIIDDIMEDENLRNILKLNNSDENLKNDQNNDKDIGDIDSIKGRDKEKLMRYDPIKRNIEMVKNIESYKKQGVSFPGIRKEKKVKEVQIKRNKLKGEPQKFFNEALCDSMYSTHENKEDENK